MTTELKKRINKVKSTYDYRKNPKGWIRAHHLCQKIGKNFTKKEMVDLFQGVKCPSVDCYGKLILRHLIIYKDSRKRNEIKFLCTNYFDEHCRKYVTVEQDGDFKQTTLFKDYNNLSEVTECWKYCEKHHSEVHVLEDGKWVCSKCEGVTV